jgi:GNAT superfamily N-acetyltransferase
MNSDHLATLPLFESAGLYGRQLAVREIPLLQALFEANPEYFLSVNGRLANRDEAQTVFDELPPPHLSFTRRWVVGLFDRSHDLVGVAVVVSDLGAAGVGHIALFLLATRLHGQGVASPIYAALESWLLKDGANWLRLVVVQGNRKAERFWSKHGFREARSRIGVDTGGRVNDVSVLVKPLGEAQIAEYLQLVPRDRPDSAPS